MTDSPSTGWTGGQQAFGDFAPGLAHYTDKVLFDEVWERPGLSKRDRSLITIAALTAMGNADQLGFHIPFGIANGLTQEEVVEAITQLTFYTGWPKGFSAMGVAKTVAAAAAGTQES
ncbi:carboxymuconolactone decarboxylase family protein [Microbacter sp. GSS18]|nr:carboxymuconolactone decarboxylase family protein [Microbacter sp. GSS18]